MSNLNTLVYIMYNKKLKDRHIKRKALKEDQDLLVIDQVPSDDEWVADEGTNENQEYVIEVDDEGDEITQASGSIQPEQRGKRKKAPTNLENRNKGLFSPLFNQLI